MSFRPSSVTIITINVFHNRGFLPKFAQENQIIFSLFFFFPQTLFCLHGFMVSKIIIFMHRKKWIQARQKKSRPNINMSIPKILFYDAIGTAFHKSHRQNFLWTTPYSDYMEKCENMSLCKKTYNTSFTKLFLGSLCGRLHEARDESEEKHHTPNIIEVLCYIHLPYKGSLNPIKLFFCSFKHYLFDFFSIAFDGNKKET